MAKESGLKLKTANRMGNYLHSRYQIKGCYMGYTKSLTKINQKYKIPIKKRKEINKNFFKEGQQMNNRHLKRCSSSLIMEIEIKIQQ